MPSSRQRIMRAAKRRGYIIDAAMYSRPAMTGMGDGLGGWRVRLRDGREYGGTLAAVIEWIMDLPMRLSKEPDHAE